VLKCVLCGDKDVYGFFYTIALWILSYWLLIPLSLLSLADRRVKFAKWSIAHFNAVLDCPLYPYYDILPAGHTGVSIGHFAIENSCISTIH